MVRSGFGSSDARVGAGRPAGEIVMPTFARPVDCKCSWSVVRPGPGWECLSRLSYRSAMCSHKHVPQQEVSRG
jgi:hypothetical protein